QVEHPVTELVTGIDLVHQQIRIAAGEKLALAQEDIVMTGHAIEARVYAEDPAAGFLPTGGPVLGLSEPAGAGVRIDSGLAAGTVVGSDYDPMLAKIIAHGDDRTAALHTLDRALADTAVLGLTTNIEFLRFLLADADVVAGRLDTGLLDRRAPEFVPAAVGDEQLIAAAAYLWARHWAAAGDNLWQVPAGWRVGERAPATFRLQAADRTDHVYFTGHPGHATAAVEHGESHTASVALTDDRLAVMLDGLRTEYQVAATDGRLWLSGAGRTWFVEAVREASVRPDDERGGDAELVSPMPGSVVAVGVEPGAEIGAGTVVVTVEAMKMEHALTAPVDGVAELLVAVGDQVKVGQPLARITAAIKEPSHD
ncbi:biotin/lipoyl-containing protein, partial [Mycobacterium sp. NPDC003449]